MIRVVFVISSLLILGCSKKDAIKNYSLECVLDSYILQNAIKDNSILFLSDMKGWSDSTSIIRVLRIQEEGILTGKLLFSKYKNIRMYMESGELQQDSIKLYLNSPNSSINSQLNLELVEINGGATSVTPPKEEFNELQFIYNPNKKCVESIIMGGDKLEQMIRYDCRMCM
jgi:hypothetical protein